MSCTLHISRYCWSCSWCNRRYGWCVSCGSFGSVLIFTNHSYSWCSSDEWFFRYKCHCSVWGYSISTNTFNCLRSWTIVKCCWNIIVHWHTAVAFSKYRLTSLCRTLDVCRCCWLSCWSYWCNCWCVGCSNWSTVLINTFHCYACTCSCEWFFWYKGYGSVWSNCVSSFTWNNFCCWTIFKGSWYIIIHWDCRVTRCEAWCTCLSLTLDVCRCCRISSWYNWSDLRCVSCLSNSSVCIFTLNLNWNHITWVWFIRWCEGHNTCFFINSEGTDHITCWWFRFYWCCWLTIFVKKSNGILVDWCNWVTFSEGDSSSLNHTLRCFWFSWSRCWSYWCYSWCVLSSNWSTVLIDTFHRYACTFSCEWFFWNKCYGSVWSNSVSTFTWNCLGCWAIFKGCRCIIIHWDIWITWCEGWSTCLRLTLFVSRCCIFCSWCNWCYGWCICRRSFCSVLIFTNHCYSWSSSNEWFFWYEGYCTVCCYCVSTNTIYSLRSWAIIEGCWNIIVHRHTAVAFGEFRFTSLSRTLDICWFSWCCSWSYWSYSWCVSCRSFCSVLIFTNNCYGWCFTCEWFFRYKGYSSVCCYCVSTNAIYCLGSWAIVESSWNVIVHWYSAVAFSKFRLTCLSLTLLTCCFNWCRCRCDRSYSWCISCRSFCSVLIFANNRHCWSSTSKWFLRYECHCSVCCYCVSTNAVNSLRSWAIVKCCWNIIVHWHAAIAFSKYRLTCLCSTLDISCFNWFRSRCYWSYSWCIRCRRLSSILIFTNNSYGWCFTCEWFLRNKGYSSVCCYCVGTNAVNCLSSWAIVKCCWNIIVHWHTAVAFSKYRLTSLSSTLDISCFSWCRSRCYWSYSWCIRCRSFGSVLIFTNNCHCWSSSSKWFLRNKGYRSVCCHCVCTNAIYCLSSWAIVKCCWNIFVDFNSFLNAINCHSSTLEFRFTFLSCTLNVSCFCWSCSWSYR